LTKHLFVPNFLSYPHLSLYFADHFAKLPTLWISSNCVL
jgi:hypothetical protein